MTVCFTRVKGLGLFGITCKIHHLAYMKTASSKL